MNMWQMKVSQEYMGLIPVILSIIQFSTFVNAVNHISKTKKNTPNTTSKLEKDFLHFNTYSFKNKKSGK